MRIFNLKTRADRNGNYHRTKQGRQQGITRSVLSVLLTEIKQVCLFHILFIPARALFLPKFF